MPAAPSDVLLDARGLGRRYGAGGGGTAGGVRDVTLALRAGDVLGLLGLNGAGKSTTLRLLAGVLAPDAGSVTIAGHSLEDAPLEARARLGYLPDLPPLYPDMRVDDYLAHAARLRRLKGAALAAAVDRAVERCRLGDVRRRRIEVLSKGYRQRVGLAQALVHEPSVLLLDEPGSGLDPQQTEELRALVTDYGREHAVVLSTHLLHEAQSVCNRVAVVHEGRLVAERAADGAELETLFAELTRGTPTLHRATADPAADERATDADANASVDPPAGEPAADDAHAPLEGTDRAERDR